MGTIPSRIILLNNLKKNIYFLYESLALKYNDVIIKGVGVCDENLFVESFVLSLFIILLFGFKYHYIFAYIHMNNQIIF